MKRWVSFVLAVTVIGCAHHDGDAKKSTPAVPVQPVQPPASTGVAGDRAADFTARDIEGNNVTLSSHLGKNVVLLSFSATWCQPCVAEFPHLRKMYEANKAKGLVILAISVDGPDTVANVPAFARRNQLNFPMLTDEHSRISSLYNPKRSAPLTVLIDKKGKIAAVREGYNPGDEAFLAKDVANALDGAAQR